MFGALHTREAVSRYWRLNTASWDSYFLSGRTAVAVVCVSARTCGDVLGRPQREQRERERGLVLGARSFLRSLRASAALFSLSHAVFFLLPALWIVCAVRIHNSKPPPRRVSPALCARCYADRPRDPPVDQWRRAVAAHRTAYSLLASVERPNFAMIY